MLWHYRDLRESYFLHENTRNYIIFNIVVTLFLGDVNLDRENELGWNIFISLEYIFGIAR